MANFAARLEVGNQRLWINVSVQSLRVSEFPHPRVFNNGEDKLHNILPRRFVGATVVSLGFLHYFRARTDDGTGIGIDRRVIIANSCGFDEFCAVARCVC